MKFKNIRNKKKLIDNYKRNLEIKITKKLNLKFKTEKNLKISYEIKKI